MSFLHISALEQLLIYFILVLVIVSLLPLRICTTTSKIILALWCLRKRLTAHSFVAGKAVRRTRLLVPRIISTDTCKTTLAVSTTIHETSIDGVLIISSQAICLQYLRPPLRHSAATEQSPDDTLTGEEVQVRLPWLRQSVWSQDSTLNTQAHPYQREALFLPLVWRQLLRQLKSVEAPQDCPRRRQDRHPLPASRL